MERLSYCKGIDGGTSEHGEYAYAQRLLWNIFSDRKNSPYKMDSRVSWMSYSKYIAITEFMGEDRVLAWTNAYLTFVN